MNPNSAGLSNATAVYKSDEPNRFKLDKGGRIFIGLTDHSTNDCLVGFLKHPFVGHKRTRSFLLCRLLHIHLIIAFWGLEWAVKSIL